MKFPLFTVKYPRIVLPSAQLYGSTDQSDVSGYLCTKYSKEPTHSLSDSSPPTVYTKCSHMKAVHVPVVKYTPSTVQRR